MNRPKRQWRPPGRVVLLSTDVPARHEFVLPRSAKPESPSNFNKGFPCGSLNSTRHRNDSTTTTSHLAAIRLNEYWMKSRGGARLVLHNHDGARPLGVTFVPVVDETERQQFVQIANDTTRKQCLIVR